MDNPTFRAVFPEFADNTKYADAQVNYYLNLASIQLSANIWGDLLDQGMGLFTAHNLVLAQQRALAAAAGGAAGVPGLAQGVVSSKSVGGASVQYNTGSISATGGAMYNHTTYGIQFYQLVKIVGAQGVTQLGVGGPPGVSGGVFGGGYYGGFC